jgi:hypothetical protein
LNEAAVSEVSSKLLELGVVFQGGGAVDAYECDALNALLELMGELATKIRSDWLSALLHEARHCKIIDAILNIDVQDPAATLIPAAQNLADDKDGMRHFSPETVHRRRDGFKFAHDILRPAFENRWRAADAQPVTTPAGS